MLDILRAETRALHEELEEIAQSSKMKEDDYLLEDYYKYILANYHFHHTVEQTIFANKHPEIKSLLLHYKRKTPFLLHDLEALRLKSAKIDFELSGQTLAHIVGYLYVAEGSMLGAAIIYKLLKENPQFQSVEAFHFLSCNAGQKRQMWTEFKHYVSNHTWKAEQKATMTDAAKEAFLLYKKIFINIQTES